MHRKTKIFSLCRFSDLATFHSYRGQKTKNKKKTLHETAQCDIPDKNSIVRLRELGKNLKDTSCRSFLDMEKWSDSGATLPSRHLSLAMP